MVMIRPGSIGVENGSSRCHRITQRKEIEPEILIKRYIVKFYPPSTVKRKSFRRLPKYIDVDNKTGHYGLYQIRGKEKVRVIERREQRMREGIREAK